MRRSIDSLQAGRGLAALAVVIHHSNLAARDFGGQGFNLLDYGYLGVDFFFVLSGFIIFHSTVGTNKKLSDYSRARFRRIFYPYWPVGIGIALLYTLLPTLSAGDRSWSWLPTLTLVPVDSHPSLSVAWTLQHEILFYLLFGAAYFRGLLWTVLIIWAALIASALFAGISTTALQLINLEFMFGILAAVATRNGKAPLWMLAISVLCFSLWIVLGANRDLSFLFGLGIAFLIPPMVSAEWRGRVSVPTWLVFLGAASYSLYLVHPLFTPVAGRLLRGHPVGILALGIAGSLAFGIAYHLIIERPLLAGKVPMPWSIRRQPKRLKRRPAL